MAGSSSRSVPVERRERAAEAPADPWAPLAGLRDEIDQLFEDFGSGFTVGPTRWRRRAGMPLRGVPSRPYALVPALDVLDKEQEIELRAELPGMDEKDIEVRLSDGMLTIRGEKKDVREEGEKEGEFYVSERRFGAFQRSIQLPEGVDRDKVEASFERGVLTVHIPRTKAAREGARRIDVKAGAR